MGGWGASLYLDFQTRTQLCSYGCSDLFCLHFNTDLPTPPHTEWGRDEVSSLTCSVIIYIYFFVSLYNHVSLSLIVDQ